MPWCSALGAWLSRAAAVFHLDPFRVNRAILAALPDRRLAGKLIRLVRDGGEETAVALLKDCLAGPRPGAPPIDYLEGNMTSVAAPGSVPRHHGARQPAPLRREGGLGAVRLVVPGLRHGQAHKPLRGRPGRPSASLA